MTLPGAKDIQPERTPWVIVAAGFHRQGGMDRANLELALYLAERQHAVHLICHDIDSNLAGRPLVTVHRVPRPAGSFLLGSPLLDIEGRRVARAVVRNFPAATVVVNGGNCLWPGINWVHYLHRAWTPAAHAAPLWFSLKQRAAGRFDRRRERRAFQKARLIVSNSLLTSRQLNDYFQAENSRIRTLYLGSDPDWGPISPEERASAREAVGVPPTRLAAAFVGALGYDNRKGFDVLFEAWRQLCARPDWDVDLLVAGGGKALGAWKARILQAGLQERIKFLGFSSQVKKILAAADLLVSPVRYEPYGLNVQEAVCRGVPALVSAAAGVAERYPHKLTPMLLPDPERVADLNERLTQWRGQVQHWKSAFESLGAELRLQSWRRMAEGFVRLAEEASATRAHANAPLSRAEVES